jgi:hypothetical protein
MATAASMSPSEPPWSPKATSIHGGRYLGDARRVGRFLPGIGRQVAAR